MGAAGCGKGGGLPTPVASLASTVKAAAAFGAIREAWAEAEVPQGQLRTMLERFLADYPEDGQVPLARIALAIVAIEMGDFHAADVQLAATDDVPAGTARDLRTVATARRLRARGESEAALGLLGPLIGKNVDPLAREVFEKELTLDALATGRDYEAISYMDAWLRATPEDDRPRTAKVVTAIVRELPTQVLETELEAMRAGGASFGYGTEIERILAARLVEVATSTGDTRLARMLLDPDAGSISAGDASATLSELASSRRGLNVVDGRTLGLLLPTESPGLRDEAADVLRGTMWALGLPRGVRARTATSGGGGGGRTGAGGGWAAGDAGKAGATSACAPPEAAPDLPEPSPDEKLRLVTRDDAGSVDRTETSLDELAGAGAAIIIAGLDVQTAARALAWSESHGVALIVLVPPETSESGDAAASATPAASAGTFAFDLGEAREDVLQALAVAAPALSAPGSVVVPLIDTGEISLFPLEGGRFGPLALAPPVSCDIPPVQAGAPRFPVGAWSSDKRRAWLVSGSPECTTDLAGELSAASAKGVMAVTLEAAALPAHSPSLRVVSASAGVIPTGSAAGSGDDETSRFASTLGRIGWWTALGRDAATLARVALRELPPDLETDAAAVGSRRARARDLLAMAKARLWSTESAGWSGEHRMRRTLCAVDAPGATPAAR
jgi:hypothetical protein